MAAYLPECLVKLLDSANTQWIMNYSVTRQARLKQLISGGKASASKV